MATTNTNQVLCPIDLSENSLATIEIATLIAKKSGATLKFLFVAPHWLPEEGMMGSEYVRRLDEEDETTLRKMRPTDPAVAYEHVFAHGNPGPEIVAAATSCESIVMSTHGHGALYRILMGSVAQYVLRHARCPVVVIKGRSIKAAPPTREMSQPRFVTSLMQHVSSVNAIDQMDAVIAGMEPARETAVPVMGVAGRCVGILTNTNVARFRELKQRYEGGDTTVQDEIFETDEFGQRRTSDTDFYVVKRHASSPVIVIANTATEQDAKKLFLENPDIHHLVVIDESNHPVGILDSTQIALDVS